MSIDDIPFMKRQAKAGTTGHGKASEKRLSKSLNARLTPASGAMTGAKGDMKLKTDKAKVLLEAKSTIHNSITVDLAWLIKINHEAMGSGSMPALSVSFVTPEGKPKPGTTEWVMVPKAVFEELIEK